jgi:hypothetical protein
MTATAWEPRQNSTPEEENQVSATLPARSGPGSYRTTARAVGVVYLVGMVVGVVGDILIQSILSAPDHLSMVSVSSMILGIGSMLWLIAAAGDTAHGVLMYPILKQHNERIAVGYLASRILDSVFVAIMVLFVLLQIPLGSEYLKAGASDTSYLQALSTVFMQAKLYAYHFGMTTVGVAGLMLCYLFYRAKLVPGLVSIWGLVGYATIFGGSVLEVLGFDLRLIHVIPGGLWELFIGVWLIAKGFSPSGIAPAPAAASRESGSYSGSQEA